MEFDREYNSYSRLTDNFDSGRSTTRKARSSSRHRIPTTPGWLAKSVTASHSTYSTPWSTSARSCTHCSGSEPNGAIDPSMRSSSPRVRFIITGADGRPSARSARHSGSAWGSTIARPLTGTASSTTAGPTTAKDPQALPSGQVDGIGRCYVPDGMLCEAVQPPHEHVTDTVVEEYGDPAERIVYSTSGYPFEKTLTP